MYSVNFAALFIYLCIYVYMCQLSMPPAPWRQTRWEGGEGRGGEDRSKRLSLLHPTYNYIVLDKWINGQEDWLSPRLVLCVCVCMYTAAAACRFMYFVSLERW